MARRKMTPLTLKWRTVMRGMERRESARMRAAAEMAWPAKQDRLRRMSAAQRAGKTLRFDSAGRWIED